MAIDNTNSYYVQQTMHLDTGDGLWVSAQTLGSRINSVKPHIHSAIEILYFMSVIQVSTVLVSSWKDLSGKPFSTNPEDHKFNRWYSLFNVVLDYMYYPSVICMLLQ